MEVVVLFLVTLLIWGALVIFTPLVWWACLLIALGVTVLGIWLGPELF